MNKETLEKFKKVLEEKKANLEKELEQTPLVDNMGSDTEGEDYSEEADEAEQMVDNAAVRSSLKESLDAVDGALEKIKKGEYDRCERCSADISEEMLEADPESKFCKTCKTA